MYILDDLSWNNIHKSIIEKENKFDELARYFLVFERVHGPFNNNFVFCLMLVQENNKALWLIKSHEFRSEASQCTCLSFTNSRNFWSVTVFAWNIVFSHKNLCFLFFVWLFLSNYDYRTFFFWYKVCLCYFFTFNLFNVNKGVYMV